MKGIYPVCYIHCINSRYSREYPVVVIYCNKNVTISQWENKTLMNMVRILCG